MSSLFSFRGRSSRSEWWSAQWIQTPICLTMVGLMFAPLADPEVKKLIGLHLDNGGSELGLLWIMISSMGIKLLIPFVFLFGLSMWIWLASHVRRLHDHNMSGKSFFLMYIPFVSTYMEYKLALSKGTPGKNDFGGSSLENESGNFNTLAADDLIFERLENRGGFEAKTPSPTSQVADSQPSRPRSFKYMKSDKPKPLFGG